MFLVRCLQPGSPLQVYALRGELVLASEPRAWSWSGRYGSGHAAIGRTRADAIARLYRHMPRTPTTPSTRIPS